MFLRFLKILYKTFLYTLSNLLDFFHLPTIERRKRNVSYFPDWKSTWGNKKPIIFLFNPFSLDYFLTSNAYITGCFLASSTVVFLF